MARTYRRKYKTSRRRSYKRRSIKSRYRRKGYKSYVKRAIAKTEEIKRAHWVVYNADINSNITDGNCVTLMPQITQDSSQSGRIGNQINIKRVILRMNALPFPTSAYGDLIQQYDMYIFKNRTSNVPTANDMNRFLQSGNTATDYDGTNLRSMYSVNKDRFDLKSHKVFNMSNVYTTQNQTGFSGPRYKRITMDITRFFKKRLRWDDSNIAIPTNDNLWIVIGGNYPQNDGLAGTQHMADYNLDVEYYYTDS